MSLPDLDDVHGLGHRDGDTATGEAGQHPQQESLPASGGLADARPAEQSVPDPLVETNPQ